MGVHALPSRYSSSSALTPPASSFDTSAAHSCSGLLLPWASGSDMAWLFLKGLYKGPRGSKFHGAGQKENWTPPPRRPITPGARRQCPPPWSRKSAAMIRKGIVKLFGNLDKMPLVVRDRGHPASLRPERFWRPETDVANL
jgi:hypothetical protein